MFLTLVLYSQNFSPKIETLYLLKCFWGFKKERAFRLSLLTAPMFKALLDIQSTLADCRTSMSKTYEDEKEAYKQYEQVKERCVVDRQNLRLQVEELEKVKEAELAKVNAIVVVDEYHSSFRVRVSKKFPDPAVICKNRAASSVDDQWIIYYLEPNFVKNTVVPNALAAELQFPTEEDSTASQAGGEFIMVQ